MHHIRISGSASRFRVVPQDAFHTQPYHSRARFEAYCDAIVVTDTHGNIAYVNEQMIQLSDWSKSELIGLNWFDLIANTTRAGIEYARALIEGRASNVELVVKSRDGSETPVNYNATPIYDRQSNLVGVFATLSNATDLKRMRRDLEAKEMRLPFCPEAARLAYRPSLQHKL